MTDNKKFQPSQQEIDRRYDNTRAAMANAGLDALIVSGSEYTGFEGAVRYMCGFHILHRYAYVLVPMDGDPIAVFPKEATWVGDHSRTFIEQQVKTLKCGFHQLRLIVLVFCSALSYKSLSNINTIFGFFPFLVWSQSP